MSESEPPLKNLFSWLRYNCAQRDIDDIVDLLVQLSNVVVDDVVQQLDLSFLTSIFLKNVVDGQEVKTLCSGGPKV